MKGKWRYEDLHRLKDAVTKGTEDVQDVIEDVERKRCKRVLTVVLTEDEYLDFQQLCLAAETNMAKMIRTFVRKCIAEGGLKWCKM